QPSPLSLHDALPISLRHAAVDLHPMVNSGLGLVHRESMRFEWLEEFLALPGILQGHFWRIEQTLFALCSSRFGVELLPDEYTLQDRKSTRLNSSHVS